MELMIPWVVSYNLRKFMIVYSYALLYASSLELIRVVSAEIIGLLRVSGPSK